VKPIQPHRVVGELANGQGVILEPLCVLCGEANEAVACPICDRTFCVELCFGVHFTARDSFDAPDRIDTFLRTQTAHELLDAACIDEKMKIDWRHGLTCDNCRPSLREMAMEALIEGAKIAVSES
jgi:hypothetical protein